MTEEEAKTKWCPFAKPDLYQNRTGMNRNIDSAPLKGALCIATACMVWRKTGSKFKDLRTGQLHDRDLTGNGQWIDVGHCGLAGNS